MDLNSLSDEALGRFTSHNTIFGSDERQRDVVGDFGHAIGSDLPLQTSSMRS